MNGKPPLATTLTIALVILIISLPAQAGKEDLLEMARKIDQLDQQDFLVALDKAEACTLAQDFSCADVQFSNAAKFATGARDQQTLEAARHKMANEKAKWTATH